MQRIAGSIGLVCALALFAGCEDKNKELDTAPAQTASYGYDQPADDPYAAQGDATGADTTYSTGLPGDNYDTYASTGYDSTGGASTTYSQPAPTATASRSGGTTHVVGKGDTLYSLARLYYGNQSKWRDIYTANSNVLRSPDKLPVGQTLVIP